MNPDQFVTWLHSFIDTSRKSNIDLTDLQAAVAGQAVDYPLFAEALQRFEQEGVLTAVKSHGRNNRVPSLAYRYRIDRQKLRRDQVAVIQTAAHRFHPAIKLDGYYRRTSAEWENDLPRIEQIHRYLSDYGLPETDVTAPERSFALTGDEKWIDEQGGRELLEKLGLWAAMRIVPASDPLMLAIHPKLFSRYFSRESTPANTRVAHLIVENKTTFHALLHHLEDLPFATLIYGSGSKIIGNLSMFPKQVPLPGDFSSFYYFGDLDWEGIRIWHSLNERYGDIRVAIPFYIAALEQESVPGKLSQRRDPNVLSAFARYLPEESARKLTEMLDQGEYIPQEVLSAKQLHDIGRMSVWNET